MHPNTHECPLFLWQKSVWGGKRIKDIARKCDACAGNPLPPKKFSKEIRFKVCVCVGRTPVLKWNENRKQCLDRCLLLLSIMHCTIYQASVRTKKCSSSCESSCIVMVWVLYIYECECGNEVFGMHWFIFV